MENKSRRDYGKTNKKKLERENFLGGTRTRETTHQEKKKRKQKHKQHNRATPANARTREPSHSQNKKTIR
jgi:hypothetical protein